MTSITEIKTDNRVICCYDIPGANIDAKTVSSFGEEWKAFHEFDKDDLTLTGDFYFDIVTGEMLNKDCTVIDIGCGSGRFIKYLDGRFKKMTGIDPSKAIFAADTLIGKNDKVELAMASTDNIPFPDNSFDFGYSLGVLHHIPDTEKALNDSVKKIRPGGYFLVYLYYNFDNRPFYFKLLFGLSNMIRLVVCKLPATLKRWVANFLAVVLYMPFILLCRVCRFFRMPDKIRRHIPLQAYERQSFYVIRNDSLDRFGTPLEQRFSRKEIQAMMERAGLIDIVFSDHIPFWHAVGKKTR